MVTRYDVVIVGAGHGGAQAAIALRQQGFAGSIALVGEEPELPYERPPLSKEYLAGEKSFERILIRPASFWMDRKIDLIAGSRVMTVDAARRQLVATGGDLAYGQLIWAAGGRARRLSCVGHDLARVHAVRTRADVDRLQRELTRTARVVVIGGGYIGLEAAAVLTKLGKHVTIIEAQDRVLARVAGEPLSRFFEAAHRSRGVSVQLGVGVDRIEGMDGVATGVRLSDGALLPADMVIVGIGIVPETEALIEAGAVGGNGVLVDAQCRTTLPDVWAIGDCALHANRFARGRQVRLESVQNANDMAVTAVRSLVGIPAPYTAVPWFWSNQYDLKLQTIGLSSGYDEVVVRGDMAVGRFSVIYLHEGRLIAIDCVNMVKDYVQAKALIEAGARIEGARLRDALIPLKDMATT